MSEGVGFPLLAKAQPYPQVGMLDMAPSPRIFSRGEGWGEGFIMPRRPSEMPPEARTWQRTAFA